MNHPPRSSDGPLCESDAASRREFLSRSKLAMAALAMGLPAVLQRKASAAAGSSGGDTLVYIFLRGGMDGLSLLAPYTETEYYNLRPVLALPPPGSGKPGEVIDIDGFFGLNPAAVPLLTPYYDGKLAFVHASGSTNKTRSHFDAMKFLEFGIPDHDLLDERVGFLARHLESKGGNSAVRGVAVDYTLPYAFFGAPKTLPARDPANFQLPGSPGTLEWRREALDAMYQVAQEPLKTAGKGALDAIDLLELVDFENYVPEFGAQYVDDDFGRRLRNTAAVLKADLGIEVLSLDIDGWDHHNAQGPVIGIYADMISSLATNLEAFYKDLTNVLGRVTIAVVTEFGRTAAENVSTGTDHGRASVITLMGGNVNGGKIYHNWPGMTDNDLDEGDLAVTVDYRDILGEILVERMGTPDLDAVFPGHVPNFLDVVS